MEKEIRTIYDPNTGQALKKIAMAWRTTDGAAFVVKQRAIDHQLEIFADEVLDQCEIDEKSGQLKVIKEGKKRSGK